MMSHNSHPGALPADQAFMALPDLLFEKRVLSLDHCHSGKRSASDESDQLYSNTFLSDVSSGCHDGCLLPFCRL
jgi:hypothetical protein